MKLSNGLFAALASAFTMGLAPVFGKLAINFGLPPVVVVAIRTVLAAFLLLAVVLIFRRRYLYIYFVGLIGCLLAGGLNGLGSLFYYSSLGRINAGMGQLIFSFYPIFVALWLLLDGQSPSRLTFLRLILALLSIFLLTQASSEPLDPVGVGLMLVASALYALHLPINQRVLFDIPAPTVTLYTLIAMSLVVFPPFLLTNGWSAPSDPGVWLPLLGLTLATFLSRLTLFFGVKHLGGLQTALIGLGELLVTLTMANLWLGESLNPAQWLGVGVLAISLLLVGFEKRSPPQRQVGGWLRWINPPGVAASQLTKR
ncbi:MAG TPA: DMT family transporter [Anaerolineales bacterium]|nr:DMT family transporter [Anaerolineales bacterium]